MTTRHDFLARVSNRLVGGVPENPIRPIDRVGNPPIAYAIDVGDPVTAFKTAVTGAGAELVETTLDDIPGVMEDLAGGGTIALTDEPVTSSIRAACRHLEVAADLEPQTLSDCALGVSGVRAAVALTGSIVIDSSIPGARVVTLLPDIHLAIVSQDQIVATPGDVFRSLGPKNMPPSNIVFITGPSRSADIELQLTIGVHGPSRLVVALV